ncbi:hypothetical protein KBB68_03490 [Candidatus Babeliales bacterium]|nr:hypothetical protein [Candidatus Babeliales bacterium]
MNQNLKRFLSITVLFLSSTALVIASASCSSCPTGCAQGQNLYQPHAFSASASRDIMLEIAAWYPQSDEEGWHGAFGVGFDYMHTFNSCSSSNESTGCCTNLGSLPFWASNNSNKMSMGNNTGGFDLDVYQLGLGPVTTDGSIKLNPIVFQVGADFLLYVGAHKTERGFFLKAHGPVGVTSIDPHLSYTETVETKEYPIGSLAQSTATAAPYENIAQAFAGGKSAGFLKPMVFGLIDCKRTSSAQFGDPEFAVGYNLFADEKKHIGIAATFSAPTGNKAEGVYVFEPIFGRNGHWGAGGEIIGHWKFWESDSSDDKWAQAFFDGKMYHLFKSKYVRSFDLKNNGAGSKYMLLSRYTATIPGVFQNEILNAVNITTVGVQSTFAAEGNFALGFDFHWKNWSLQIGYEGWGRTCESLTLDCTCPGSTNYNEYAVLGRQQPFNAGGVAIDLCQPTATIGESLAYSATATSTILLATTAANRLPETAEDVLDVEGQRARSVYTSKPWAEIRYTWADSDYVPFLAITGGAEIPNTHKNEAAKMWNVGVNGGIAF